MRPDIYSCSSSSKRIRLKVGFQNNKNSEPPPKNSANPKSVGEQRHGAGLHFALVTMLSFLSTSSPFLVTVNSSLRVLCVLDLSKRLSKRVSVKNSAPDFLLQGCFQASVGFTTRQLRTRHAGNEEVEVDEMT